MSKFIQRCKNVIALITILIKQQVRRIRNQPIIHIIGDSHSLLFQHELFKIHYIGPATAFNLFTEHSSNQSKQKILEIMEKLKNSKKPYIMFVLGEIDSRIHIYKVHKEKNIPLEEVIEQTAKRYSLHLAEIMKLFPNMQVMVFNVLPPGEQGNVYKYSHYADRATRLHITEILNQKLKEYTSQHNIPFIETYNELIDNKKDRIKEFVFDDIHYSNKIIPAIIKKICQKNLLHG